MSPRPRTSAGLLAYSSDESGARLVFLAHMGGPYWSHRDDGAWSIPKGEYDESTEDPAEAARREFAEEIGAPAPDGPLTDLGIHVQPGGKRVRAYGLLAPRTLTFVASNLFDLEWPRGSGTLVRFPEIDRAGWFDQARARRKILSGQIPILDALDRAVPPAG